MVSGGAPVNLFQRSLTFRTKLPLPPRFSYISSSVGGEIQKIRSHNGGHSNILGETQSRRSGQSNFPAYTFSNDNQSFRSGSSDSFFEAGFLDAFVLCILSICLTSSAFLVLLFAGDFSFLSMLCRASFVNLFQLSSVQMSSVFAFEPFVLDCSVSSSVLSTVVAWSESVEPPSSSNEASSRARFLVLRDTRYLCLLSIVENHRKFLTIVFRTKDSGASLHTH